MNLNRSLFLVSLFVGLQFFIGCSASETTLSKIPDRVEWGLPSDCNAGHAESSSQKINGLVRAENCHAGHFDGGRGRRVVLPEGQFPSIQDYDLVMSKH